MNSKTFHMINIVACILSVALLIFAFTYPKQMLKELSEDTIADTHTLISAIQSQDWPHADTLIDDIEQRFLDREQPLRLFLDHEDIDEMQMTIKGVHRLVEQRDNAQLLFELEHIINMAQYIYGIESFSFHNLF